MEQAIRLAAEAYEGDRYKGFGSSIHQVPLIPSVSGYDHYPEEQSALECEMLSRPKKDIDPDLLAEYQQLMRHRSSYQLREEFTRCSDVDCALCSRRPKRPTKLDQFLNRFPGSTLPTPLPVLRPERESGGRFESYIEGLMRRRPQVQNVWVRDASEHDDPEPEEDVLDFTASRNGHYRTLWELTKSLLPAGCYEADKFYSGPNKGRKCLLCPRLTFRTDTALQRHKTIIHKLQV